MIKNSKEDNSFFDSLLNDVPNFTVKKLDRIKISYVDNMGLVRKSTYLDLLRSVYDQISSYLTFKDQVKWGFGWAANIKSYIKSGLSVEMRLGILNIIEDNYVYTFMPDRYDIVTLCNKPENDTFDIILTIKDGEIEAKIDPAKFPSCAIAQKVYIDNIFTYIINKVVKEEYDG